jgi:transketolase
MLLYHLSGKGFPNVEDLENWHGKPLGAQAEPAIAACKAAIVNPGPHGLTPNPVVDDAPHFTLPQVKLNSPPDYKLGEKVKDTSLTFLI